LERRIHVAFNMPCRRDPPARPEQRGRVPAVPWTLRLRALTPPPPPPYAVRKPAWEITMSDAATKRRGGTSGRRAERAAAPIVQKRYITRDIPLYELLNPEGLEVIHQESMTILEEIGLDFRYEPALDLWKKVGAQVDGQRIRFPRGL